MDPAIIPRVRARALLRRDWDVVVIGSGVGGLVCAVLLAARARRRVLVLERHYEPGGLSQMFRRRRFSFDTGVHIVGEMQPGALLRRTFDAATGRRLEWVPLPSPFVRVLAPGIDARLGGPPAMLRAQWLRLAPGEERAIDRLLEAVAALQRAVPAFFLARTCERPSRSDLAPFLALAERTMADVIAETGASARLAGLMVRPWSDLVGASPERASFAAFGLTLAHYFGGGFYPVGGGRAIAVSLARTLVEHGGALVVRAPVARILVADRRVRGVLLDDGVEIPTPVVVSDAGASSTFERLLDVPTQARSLVAAIGPSDAHVGLYVGVARAPRDLGIDGTFTWIGRDPIDAPVFVDGARWAEGEEDLPPALSVSTACAVDPAFAARFPGRSALAGVVRVPATAFERWAALARADRGEEYRARKQALSRSACRLLRAHLDVEPLEHLEASTPLTTAHFTAHAHGPMYGLCPSPLRFAAALGPYTEIAGLFLTGQDAWTSSVGGAAAAGLATACAASGRDLVREILIGR